MKNFLRIFLLTFLILPSNVFAQVEDDEEPFYLKDALAQLKKKEPPLSLEARLNENEIIFRYKRFFVDYNRVDSQKNLNFIKMNVNNEIFSLMGTGLNWSYGVTGITWKDSDENNFVPVPTVGIDFYMTIRPRVKFYTQFSGMPVGGFGRIYDAETGFKYSPSKHFTITAGYRHFSAKVHDKNNFSNFTTSGAFVGVRSDF